jgi:heme iron utilization protein
VNQADKLKNKTKQLLESQRLGVLSTHFHGQPYSSLVAFASSENLRKIYFATPKSTRKFRNLTQDHRVSMLVDNRSNEISDFHHAMAVTVLGSAREVQGSEKEAAKNIYLVKHPYLTDFVKSASCALVVLDVDKYILVSRFQEVFELHIKI